MYIDVSDTFCTDGEWYWGQSIVDDNGHRVAGPFFFGPYATEQEANTAHDARVAELMRLGNVDPSAVRRIQPNERKNYDN